MNHKRFGMIAAFVMTGALALTACNGDDSAGKTKSEQATSGARVLGAYAKDTPGARYFGSVLSGTNEAPAGKQAVGDKDGRATALMRIQGDDVSFAFAWTGTEAPTMGHLHQGAQGKNGDVRISFFTRKLKDAPYVYGTVKVHDDSLLEDIEAHPDDFYVNLHTAEFPGGAVRGQLAALPGKFSLPHAIAYSSLRSVVKGAQVYACTKQEDGSYAFTQDGVEATLQGDIRHDFAEHGPAGPPRWTAPDGSAVTGTVLRKFDHGAGNIPQLLLRARQVGKGQGLLAKTEAVLRLNTSGGVAPAGACDPAKQPTTRVPYQADYLFVSIR
ncbi:CHRD domain-containing protein [Streptomyces sp. LP11]|uniref:CHRD domain-containing protein n=1 Tax=Streptomyces pyxinicus TaxID=2970331 RepID=A0ABT2B7C3_9ACTN|nr:CHRD domain-containing protein [Streptomyces sp. LP11]MCS0604414.1 CHRD domain-containing protein [Streptomyces sp. LP11]